MNHEDMYVKTPLMESASLTKLCGMPAYMKMENFQNSGSFKIRGISFLVLKCKKAGAKKLVTASEGNAGMATAYAGKVLHLPTTVVVPESTPKFMISKLEAEGAYVQVSGRNWIEAQEKALEIAEDDSTEYIHPFDDTYLTTGIEPIVYEIVDLCPLVVSAIVLPVGGGSLLAGVLYALILSGREEIPVIALETQGAHCFNAAVKAGAPVSIGKITSLATSLGAYNVASDVMELLPLSNVISKVVTDKDAVEAVEQFLDDERFLVEPSCGAALAAAYTGIISDLVSEDKIDRNGAVVFIVSGGNGVSMKQLQEWKKIVGL